MNDAWFYHAFGEEHGPVSFARLQEMAVKKQLTPQDRVRFAEWKEWVPARTVPQLFPNLQPEPELAAAEDINDLDFQSIQVAERETASEMMDLEDIRISEGSSKTARPPHRVDSYGSRLDEEAADPLEPELASLDDLDIQITDDPTARGKTNGPVDAYGSPLRADSEAGELWICQMLGHQLGPMPWGDLREMTKKGEISLDDRVRRADDTEWRPARTIEGLFQGFEYTTDPGSSERIPAATGDAPFSDRLDAKDDLADGRADISGTETAARQEAKTARPGRRPRKASSSQAKPKRKKPGSKAKASSVGTKSDSFDKWLADEVPEDEVPATPEQTAAPPAPLSPPPAVEPAAPAKPPQPAVTPADRMAEMMRAQLAAKPAAPSIPKAPKVKGPPLGERFSDLFGQLMGNPKALGVVVVLALVLIIKYAPISFGASDQEYLDQITVLGNTFKELRTRKASGAEYDTFKKETLPQVEALHSELEDAGAGAADRPKQEMLWACDKLKDMLQGSLEAEDSPAEKSYDKHIAIARDLIQSP